MLVGTAAPAVALGRTATMPEVEVGAGVDVLAGKEVAVAGWMSWVNPDTQAPPVRRSTASPRRRPLGECMRDTSLSPGTGGVN
jgi:hypothetical protein